MIAGRGNRTARHSADGGLRLFGAVQSSIGVGACRIFVLARADARQSRTTGRLTKLKPIVEAKLDELRRTVTLARHGDRAAALAIVKSGYGKRLMDGIRDELDSFSQAELNRLTEQQAFVLTLRGWLLALICLSLAAAMILVGLLALSPLDAIGVGS